MRRAAVVLRVEENLRQAAVSGAASDFDRLIISSPVRLSESRRGLVQSKTTGWARVTQTQTAPYRNPDSERSLRSKKHNPLVSNQTQIIGKGPFFFEKAEKRGWVSPREIE